MKLGFECSTVVPGHSGIGRYAERLGAALSEALGPDDEAWALTNGEPVDGLRAAPRAFPASPRALWLHAAAPRLAARLGLDLCHFTADIAPAVTTVPYVLTVHDASILRLPETHPLRRRLYYAVALRRSVRRARSVVTVSRASADDICSLLDVPRERVHAIPLAADERFRPDRGGVPGVRARYGLDMPYLLYVGTVEPRKNLGRLFRAFARLGRADVELAVAGGLGWLTRDTLRLATETGCAGRIRLLGYVPDADLPALYSGAEAFVYPSLLEGFGLPVLEAMACGAPVVASRGGALAEVAGDAALLVDPMSVDEIATSIERLLGDAGTRERLSSAGLAHAAAYSWAETARRTVEVYRSALA